MEQSLLKIILLSDMLGVELNNLGEINPSSEVEVKIKKYIGGLSENCKGLSRASDEMFGDEFVIQFGDVADAFHQLFETYMDGRLMYKGDCISNVADGEVMDDFREFYMDFINKT